VQKMLTVVVTGMYLGSMTVKGALRTGRVICQ